MVTRDLELAERAVACKYWRWLPGMLTMNDSRVVFYGDDGDSVWVCTALEKVRCIDDEALPDLTDPATVGCLLALVREAWGDPTIGAIQTDEYEGIVCGLTVPLHAHWLIVFGGTTQFEVLRHGETEAAALVVALEDAL